MVVAAVGAVVAAAVGGERADVPAPTVKRPRPVALPFNLDGVSTDAARGDGDFDGKHHTIAAELLPARLMVDGVPFTFGSGLPGQKNVLVPAGQTIAVPDGFNRLYLLAAAIGGDVPATIGLGPAASRTITVRDWQGPVGQWWSRLKENAPALQEPFAPAGGRPTPSQQEIQAGLVVQWDPKTGRVSGIDQIRPAYVKRDEIAWVGSHRHDPTGNEPYVSSYLFLYVVDVPAGTKEIRLPANDRIRILAATVSSEANHVTPAGAIYMADFADSYVVPAATCRPRQRRVRRMAAGSDGGRGARRRPVSRASCALMAVRRRSAACGGGGQAASSASPS